MRTAMEREPVTVVTLAQVLLALAVSFGLDLTGDQTAAILATVAVIGNLIARNFTWSPASVEYVTGRSNEASLELLHSED